MTQLTPEQIKRKKDHWKKNWKSKGPLPEPKIRRIKRGAKSWNKKLNKMAKDAHLGRPFMKLEKPKKKKDYVIDPDETFGGRRIQKKGGPELIPPKRKDDVGVGGYQEPLKNIKRPAGLGAALRGGGRAFVKGGKV